MTRKDYEWLARELARLLHLDMLTQAGYRELVLSIAKRYTNFNIDRFMARVSQYVSTWQTMETD